MLIPFTAFTMNAQGSRGVATFTLNLGIRWRLAVNFTLWSFYSWRKSSQYPL